MRIIALASVKGGTGRTTVAAHLGGLLAQAGHAAIVVDLDPQNALGLWYRMEPGEHFGIARRGAVAEDLLQFVRRSRSEVPYLPFGYATYEELVQLEHEVEQGSDWLRRKLEMLTQGNFDYVILDTPAGFGPFTREALWHADVVLSVLLADGASYATVPAMQEFVAEMCEGRRDFQGAWFLLNQMDARRPLHRDVKLALSNLLQDSMLPVALPPDESVREALANRQSLFYQNPDSAVLAALRDVAGWLVGSLGSAMPPNVVQGF